MKIYTKRGDQGNTNVIGGATVRKSDSRIACYGTLDELNSQVGLLVAHGVPERIQKELTAIQHHLFDVGSILADPHQKLSNDFQVSDKTDQLERWIDAHATDLPDLKYFVLPGGTVSASTAHVCRTITRRAERLIVTLSHEPEVNVDIDLIQYINRLSSYFFVIARQLNHQAGSEDTFYTGTGEVFH